MKKWLIMDMDNTLCESCRPIDREMKQLLYEVSKKYIIVVIAGSSIKHIKEQCGGAFTYMLSNSGTEFYYLGRDAPTYSHYLSTLEKDEIIRAIKETMDRFKILEADEQIQDRGSQITFSVLGRNAPHELKEAYDQDKRKRKQIKTRLIYNLGDNYEITIGGTTSLDITKKGMNKGFGIGVFANRMGIKLWDIVFIGDGLFEGGNDESVKGVVKYIHVKNPSETKDWLRWLL